MNATHFFERVDQHLPSSSESFWSAVFALFLLHLTSTDGPGVDVWRTCGAGRAPWYQRKGRSLDCQGLRFEGLAVEPQTLTKVWPEIDSRLSGIAPDLFLHLDDGHGRPKYLLVENKITSHATLNANQVSVYPELIKSLTKSDISAQLFVLHGVGCSHSLYAATRKLEADIPDHFGILLWEDVFRLMSHVNFPLPGLDLSTLRDYTEDAVRDAQDWQQSAYS